jgi:hypothetical protein
MNRRALTIAAAILSVLVDMARAPTPIAGNRVLPDLVGTNQESAPVSSRLEYK